jgi:hypothetical protein
MPNAFNRLKAIIGARLAKKVSEHMGGQIIRIRKRIDPIREIYFENPEAYNGKSIRIVAEILECSEGTARNLRGEWRKNHHF